MTSEEFQDRLNAIMSRGRITPSELARYLGVPMNTLTHWLRGERMPGAASLRLLELLELVEIVAPQVHDRLIGREE